MTGQQRAIRTSRRTRSDALAAVLDRDDLRRATEVIRSLLDHGLRGALTGSLAIDLQLQAHGQPVQKHRLNDIDVVVESFDAIPESLAGQFLQHHVHPDASDGRMLLQLVDDRRALRVDLFRGLGATLPRACSCGDLTVLSIEDLIARTTALVCGRLGRGRTLDPKHARAFRRLRGFGKREQLAAAWHDHRQQVPGHFDEATDEAERLLERHADLVLPDEYSDAVPACSRCRPHGRFQPAPVERIVDVLGYA